MGGGHEGQAVDGQGTRPTGAFVCVCRAYGPVEAALASSWLDAAGLLVFSAQRYTVANAWHWTHVLDGVALAVPIRRAADAEALLAEFRPMMSRLGAVGLLVCMVGFLMAGVPYPASGLFPVRVTVGATPQR